MIVSGAIEAGRTGPRFEAPFRISGDYTELWIVTPALMLAAGFVFGVRLVPAGSGKTDDREH